MSDLNFALQHLNPVNFHRSLWQKGIRSDGRTFLQLRHISTKKAVGSCMVKWGSTLLSCGVVPQIGVPSFTAPDCGDIVVNVSLGSHTSSVFDRNKDDQAYALEKTLTDLILENRMLDLTSLCIVPGKAAFRLVINLVFLSLESTALDAAILALSAALSHAELPTVTLDSVTNMYAVDGDAPTVPLVLHRKPICLSCAIFESHIILDPSPEESASSAGTISLTYNSDNSLCLVLMHVAGGVSKAQMNEAVRLCSDKVADIRSSLKL